MTDSLADRIDAVLPQTQCRQCGYSGCHPYADAIVAGHADINRCPPGGGETLRALSDLTGQPMKAVEGVAKPSAIAKIDETACIGCTLCIQACPVDAIIGAANVMHTVISSECTGCELCLPPCPVDCIEMAETGQPVPPPDWLQRAAHYRFRFEAREARLERDRLERAAASRTKTDERRKRATIARVMERARRRLRQR